VLTSMHPGRSLIFFLCPQYLTLLTCPSFLAHPRNTTCFVPLRCFAKLFLVAHLLYHAFLHCAVIAVSMWRGISAVPKDNVCSCAWSISALCNTLHPSVLFLVRYDRPQKKLLATELAKQGQSQTMVIEHCNSEPWPSNFDLHPTLSIITSE
jgi:hypothetical protein